LTIKQLESRSGVSASFISRIENDTGNPSVEIVRKLAEALGIPLSDFFFDQKGGKILYPLRLTQARLLQDPDVAEMLELLVGLSNDQRKAVVQITAGAVKLLKAPGGRAATLDVDAEAEYTE
jgi:transcriptional regulator with XRE-family HTH domain